MAQYQWVLCPICGGKTRTKIRPDTWAKNLIVFCPKCKKESVIDVKPEMKQSCKCIRLRNIKSNMINNFEEEIISSDIWQSQILKKTSDGRYFIELRFKGLQKNKIVEVIDCPMCGEPF